MAFFGRMTAEEMATKPPVKKVTVVNNVDEPLNLTNLRSSNPAFQLESKVIEAGKKAEIAIALLTPLKNGLNYGRIEADTGVAEMPRLVFVALARLVQDVKVVPAVITLQGPFDKPTKRFVTIQNNTNRPMTVSDLEISNPAITALLSEVLAGKRFRIMLEIPAGTEIAAVGETITIKTDNPKFPELIVPIRQRAVPTRIAKPGTNRCTTQSKNAPDLTVRTRPFTRQHRSLVQSPLRLSEPVAIGDRLRGERPTCYREPRSARRLSFLPRPVRAFLTDPS